MSSNVRSDERPASFVHAGRSRLRARGALVLGLLLASVAGCESCLKRRPADAVPLLPYPTCPEAAVDEVVLFEETLRAGPAYPTKDVLEHYRIARRGCHHVATVRQQWSRQLDEVEVVYDSDWLPLRAWKRMTVPGTHGRGPLVDTRRYEFRTLPVSMTLRNPDGMRHYTFKRPERPVAVVGPGRGLIAAFVAGHPLRVGQTFRGPTLDIRELVERLEPVSLRREVGVQDPGLGAVDVYTVYGRESVLFREGAVVGDLLGLRPTALSPGAPPPEFPSVGPPDPVDTP